MHDCCYFEILTIKKYLSGLNFSKINTKFVYSCRLVLVKKEKGKGKKTVTVGLENTVSRAELVQVPEKLNMHWDCGELKSLALDSGGRYLSNCSIYNCCFNPLPWLLLLFLFLFPSLLSSPYIHLTISSGKLKNMHKKVV